MEIENMELSTQILINEALRRGIGVDVIDEPDNFIRLKKGEKTEYIKQATKTSVDTYISTLIMENKEVTKYVLRENGISVPEGKVFNTADEAFDSYDKFAGMEIVIKPKSTNFGEGVAILRQNWNREDYNRKIIEAFQHDSSVIIEEFIDGKEYRFLVIGGETAAILHRVPANVTGDGTSPIRNLIELKNRDPLRGTGYKKPLEKISMGKIEEEHLKKSGKNFGYVPQKGEVVFLRENSNISTGGDSIDFTDDIIEEYKKIAVKSAAAVGAKICGADIIIKDIKALPEKGNYSIIELNFNPALHIHDYPYKGINRHVECKVLDLLGL